MKDDYKMCITSCFVTKWHENGDGVIDQKEENGICLLRQYSTSESRKPLVARNLHYRCKEGFAVKYSS